MPSFRLEVICSGLLAIVQAADEKGFLLVAPTLDQAPSHDLKLTISGSKSGDQSRSIPPGYELRLLVNGVSEFPRDKIEIPKMVKVQVPTDSGSPEKEAILLDTSDVVAGSVNNDYLKPLTGTNNIPKIVAFRARLMAGKMSLSPQPFGAIHRAMTFKNNGVTKVDKKRLVKQVILRKEVADAEFIDLSFKPMRPDGSEFSIRLSPGVNNVVSLRIANEEDPVEFCKIKGDSEKLKHSVAAFTLLDLSSMPTVELTANHEGDTYLTLDQACEKLEGHGGKEPAICYVVKIPVSEIVW